jgi:hypothetical protein
MLFRRDVPGEQRQLDGIEQFVAVADLDSEALDDDAEGVPVSFSVDLERHPRLRDQGGELRSLCSAKHDRSVVDHVVDREDLGAPADDDGQAADFFLAKQSPALVLQEDSYSRFRDHHPSMREAWRADHGKRSLQRRVQLESTSTTPDVRSWSSTDQEILITKQEQSP